ncbi:MAG: SpoIID/LytB domain-containing protein [Chloroflexota bacterium]
MGGLATLAAPGILTRPRVASAQVRGNGILARVLIRRPDSSVDAASIAVSGDGEFAAYDGNGDGVAKFSAGKLVSVGRDGEQFWIQEGSNRLKGLAGPIRFNGTGDGAPLRNQSGSGGETYTYRGTLEVASSTGGAVALVNVLGVEEYLYGVVTRELPASFGAEPLKAQAVAARTYALARRQGAPHRAQSADVCDSQHCQAYFGLNGELPAGRAAVDGTRGLVLSRGGSLFEPLYSSACGGHTEAAARIFGQSQVPGDKDAVADGEIPRGADLASDGGALTFFKSTWDSNCSGSDRYRWQVAWGPGELRAMVQNGIARFQGTSSVASSGDGRVDLIEDVSVPERGPSGRALAIRFAAPSVSWTVKRDWGIRNFMRTPSGELLPSSAVALEVGRNGDGSIGSLTAYGAGWGHGAGMCQWGTRGLSARGLAFDAILGYYYPFADMGEAILT